MSKDNSIRAFPKSGTGWQDGMTLRDYFAAKAMTAMISNGEMYGCLSTREADFKPEIANQAYAMADAMMEAKK